MLFEACGKILTFEDVTIYKIIYSAFVPANKAAVNPFGGIAERAEY
jgi:hypothetical protein